MTLPTGHYLVEAVTPLGRTTQDLVSLGAGTVVDVVVTTDSGSYEPDEHNEMQGIVEVELAATSACTLLADTENRWVFGPDQELAAVPTATFRLDGREWTASLPLNPSGRQENETTCNVEPELSRLPPRIGVRYPSTRPVGRTIDGMLMHHEAMAGAGLLEAFVEMVGEAGGLLVEKYGDPTAATLAGLTLHRFGRLHGRQAWIENVARDFPWIPDARVLLAALLMDDPVEAERSRGLGVLIDATGERPLYTDGLALAVRLLRRWPGGEGETRPEQRRTRLEQLAAYSCVTHWDSVALVTGREDQWV